MRKRRIPCGFQCIKMKDLSVSFGEHPGGAHLKFNIGWVNNRFTDVANVYLHVEYDNSQDCQCGRLKLSSGEVSSVSKNLTWDGKYNGLWVSITCRLK